MPREDSFKAEKSRLETESATGSSIVSVAPQLNAEPLRDAIIRRLGYRVMRRNGTVALSSASISWRLDGNLTVVTVATLTVLLLIGFSLAPLYAIDDMTAAELLAELPISDS